MRAHVVLSMIRVSDNSPLWSSSHNHLFRFKDPIGSQMELATQLASEVTDTLSYFAEVSLESHTAVKE